MILRPLVNTNPRCCSSIASRSPLAGLQPIRSLSLPSNSHRRPYPILSSIGSFRASYATSQPNSQSCTKSKSAVSFREHTPPTPAPPMPNGILSRFLPTALTPEPGSASSLKKLIALAAPEKRSIAGAVGLLLVSSSISMSVPFTIGRLIDYFSNPNAELFLGLSPTTALVVLLAFFTTGALANAGRVLLFRSAGFRIVARLRSEGYRTALRQDIEYVERGVGEGDLVSRLNNDSGIVGESVTQNLSDGLRSIVTASVGLSAMFWLSPTMTLLMMSIVPPVILGAVFYGRYIKRISNKTQEAIGDMSKAAQESLHSLRTVQAFGGYPIEEKSFNSQVNKVVEFNRKEALASATFFGSTGWSGNVTLLMLLGYGGTLVSRGEISVGDLTSLLLYTAYVGSALGSLSSFFSSIMKGIGAGGRVFGLLEREPLIPYASGLPFPKPDPTAGDHMGTIRFEQVSFNYPSRPKVAVLKDFNLELKSGESVALVGRSGSGKSSVDNLLLRFYDPTSGKITYDGRDIKEFDVNSWRTGLIGLVPQEPVLFTGTIRSNIVYGNPEASQAQLEEAARQANCEFIWDLPNGFDTEVGRASLSGGQKQRIAIARALLPKPSLLVLDEATSALDATSELQVNDAIDRILRQGNLTCLIVAHRLSTVARADRVVVLDGGRIVEQGLFHELATREGSKFRELMKAQFSAASPSRRGSPESSAVTESESDMEDENENENAMAAGEDGNRRDDDSGLPEPTVSKGSNAASRT